MTPEATELARRVDTYLVRRGRPQTTSMLSFIFAGRGDRLDVIKVLDELAIEGKISHSHAVWEATQAPA